MGVINLGILIKKIMGKIAGAGYVKNTDYATSSKGGTIKVDSTYATDITSGGKLKAKEITAEAYSEANDAAFISKKTLDNVLAAQPSGGVTVTQLFSGSVVQGDSTWKTLSQAYTGFTFLLVNSVSGANSNSGELILVSNIQTSEYNTNKFGFGSSNISLRFDSADATHFCAPSGSGAIPLSIYGIK